MSKKVRPSIWIIAFGLIAIILIGMWIRYDAVVMPALVALAGALGKLVESEEATEHDKK